MSMGLKGLGSKGDQVILPLAADLSWASQPWNWAGDVIVTGLGALVEKGFDLCCISRLEGGSDIGREVEQLRVPHGALLRIKLHGRGV